jgi:hypothetical protein
MFVIIRKMSDNEETPGITVVDVEKPEKPSKQKKPRTEAQKKATAKALEALAEHRAKKYAAAIEEEVAKTPKGRTAPIPIVTAPKLVASVAAEPKEPKPSYSDDIKLLREELAALKKKKSKKPIKKVIYESESDDESEEEDEVEEVVVRGKKTHIPVRKVRVPEPKADPKPAYDNRREILESIFFRNQ